MPRLKVTALLRALDRLDAPTDAWLVGVAQAVYGLCSGREGVRVFTYAVDGGAQVCTRVLATGEDFDIDPEAFHARMSPAALRSVYRAGARVGFVGGLLLGYPGIAEQVRRDLVRRRAIDVFNVHAADDASGVAIVVPTHDAAVGRRTVALLGRGAAQLQVALRFRDALRAGVGRDAALVSPSGAIEAIGGRLAATAPIDEVRALVRARERERGRASADPGVGASWIGLLRGTWSCVDLFEADGRRHVVVARTPPPMIAERALTPREFAVIERLGAGASAKATAIELGIGEAEVSRTLSRALARLGLRDLAALLRARALLDG